MSLDRMVGDRLDHTEDPRDLGEVGDAVTLRVSGPLVPPPASQSLPPRAACAVVERRPLLRRLTRSVDEYPLTLITAPAGYGKTVLAADWAGRRPRGRAPVAWVTLTDRDNSPAVFWVHLQMALAMVGAMAADVALRPMFPDAADVDALSERLLQLAAPVVLVIDAAERLRGRAIFDQLARLVDAAGDRLRLVVTTRGEPALPVHRYRVENRVTEIDAHELALSRDEVERVLVAHHLPSRDVVDEVLRRTEGWAAGVRLAAMRLQEDGPRAELDGFATSYLRAEVVAHLTPLEHDVLARTSVAEVLPPGLAPIVADCPEADDVLQALSSRSSFVLPVPGHPGAFRVHPLVREILHAELDRDVPGKAEAHRRAAAWFGGRGELEPAVHHAAAAGDWEHAAGLVLEGPGLTEVLVGTSTGDAIAEHLAPLPDRDSTDVRVLRSAIALRDGDLETARACLERGNAEAQGGRRALAFALVRTAWHDAAGRPDETLQAALEARSRLDRIGAAPDLLTAAAIVVAEGAARLRTGDLDAACTALGEAVSATSGRDGPLRLRCLALLSLAEACRGRLTRALALVDAAERSAVDLDVPVAARPATLELTRAWVALERQDLAQAQRSLDRVNRLPECRDDETWQTLTALLRARLLRDRGDGRGARRLLGRTGTSVAWLGGHVDGEARAVGCEVGEPAQPVASTPGSRLHDLLARADDRCQAGDPVAAKLDVARALQLGHAERFRRPFAHTSPRVRALIRGDAGLYAKADWLRPEQIGGDGGPTAMTSEPVLEALSERELQVLRHLAGFLTTEEIASEMFISVNTVRTHVRRVLEKLSVSRRNEAVRRGRELGLV